MKKEILDKIEKLHVGKIKYSGGVLTKSTRTLKLSFVTNVAVEPSLIDDIKKLLGDYVPNTVNNVEVEIRKIVTQNEFVVKSTIDYLQTNHTICSSEINSNDVEVEIVDEQVNLTISVEHSTYAFYQMKNVDEELKCYLQTQFVESFNVFFKDKGVAEVDESRFVVKVTENDLRRNIIRTFKVDDVVRLFDNDSNKTASYICDTKDYIGEVYHAGTITNIRELKTKTEKPYYIIDITDKTGSVSGTIFPNKDKVPKVQKLAVSSEIILHGEYEMRNGYHNLRINSINYCAFPKNFVMENRPKRPVPKEYSLIFPQKLEIENQGNFLVDDSVPECFKGRSLVAFDLETTGKDFDDKITEIGAVKIVDGKFISYFSTLVNPQKHIPEKIVELTGIDDALVEDAPIFDDVCADFYKYCDGSTMVAHNIEFDSRFIKKQSEPLDYYYENYMLDTLALARESIKGVANYKLNTLCDKYNIVFNHHRAYADALACGKLLIEIMKIKKEFPF